MIKDKRQEMREWIHQCRRMEKFTDRMRHYKALVDKNIARGMIGRCNVDWDKMAAKAWQLKVTPILNKLPHIDYNNNLLFICKQPTVRTTFFAAFYKLGFFVGYRYMSVLDLQDLFNGVQNRGMVHVNIFGVNSFQDLTEDVLLTYVSSSMAEVDKVPEFWTTLMSARSVESGLALNRKNTWIYFEGTIEELRNSRFSLWEEFFNKNGVIIDLNNQNRVTPDYDKIFLNGEPLTFV